MRVIVHLHTETVASICERPSVLERFFGARRRTYGVRRRGATWLDDDGPVRRVVSRAIEDELRATRKSSAVPG